MVILASQCLTLGLGTLHMYRNWVAFNNFYKRTTTDCCLNLLSCRLFSYAAPHFFTAFVIPGWNYSHLLHAATCKVLVSSSFLSTHKQFCFLLLLSYCYPVLPQELYVRGGVLRCEVRHSPAGTPALLARTFTYTHTQAHTSMRKQTSRSLQNKQDDAWVNWVVILSPVTICLSHLVYLAFCVMKWMNVFLNQLMF